MKNSKAMNDFLNNIIYYANKLDEINIEELKLAILPPPENKVVNERIEKIIINSTGTISMFSAEIKHLTELVKAEIHRIEQIEDEHYITEKTDVNIT
jgi:hypothetical protein